MVKIFSKKIQENIWFNEEETEAGERGGVALYDRKEFEIVKGSDPELLKKITWLKAAFNGKVEKVNEG